LQDPLKGFPRCQQLSFRLLGSTEDHIGTGIVCLVAQPLLTESNRFLKPSLLAVGVRQLGEGQGMGIRCQLRLAPLDRFRE
jgi:hypothetical protein